MPWNPDQYHRFQNERFAPFDDLLALLNVRPGLQVIDLGCGTGELTRRLADQLPDSKVMGVDSSPEMLQHTGEYARPGLTFEKGDIQNITGEWDLIFSNAAIQWVPDHAVLIPGLFHRLKEEGQIMIQMPSNHDHPTHRLIIETAQEEPFKEALGGWNRRSPVLPVEQYAWLLYQAGGQELVVFEKVYPHVLSDADALVAWTSGTALVPYFERLGDSLKEPFLERYREKLHRLWPQGPVFYGFKRILFSARRMAGK